MPIDRIPTYPMPDDSDSYPQRLITALQNEAHQRVLDFDILKLSNVPWVDVRAYGAKGDNATDDSGAIQAAIDAIDDDDGGVLFLAPNTAYKTDSTLTVDAKEYFVILGNQATIRYTGTGNALLLSGQIRWCVFENFWIRCASDNSNQHDYTGLKIDTTTSSINKNRFRNIAIYDADTAINIDGTNGFYFSIFEGMELYNFDSYGLKGTGTINANTFDFSLIQEASATGVGIDLVGNSNRINVDNLSDLADGIIIDGHTNKIRIGYTENITAQAYTNKTNINYLDFGYMPEGVKITSGAIKHNSPFSGRMGYDYYHPRNRGLVGEWRFNEGTGTSVADFSPTANNIALTNTPGWVAGLQGWATQFVPGSSEYGTITDDAAYDTTTDFSIFIVFKLDAAATGSDYIFTKGLGGGGERFVLYYSGGAIRLQMYDGAANVFDENLTIYDLHEGTGYGGWVALTITYDNAATEWKTYQGGYLTKTIDAGTEDVSSGNIYIAASNVPGDYCPLTVAKFAWYDRKLSHQEAFELSEDYYNLSGT